MSQQISLAQQIDYIIYGGYDDIDAAPEFLVREAIACYMAEIKEPSRLMTTAREFEFITETDVADATPFFLRLYLSKPTVSNAVNLAENMANAAQAYGVNLIRDQFNDRVAEIKK